MSAAAGESWPIRVIRSRKPHPSAVERALDLLDRPAYQSVLVGDSVTDIQVSRATGIRSIGFAKTPIRGRELQAAGADAVTDSVAVLAELIRRSNRS
jgi:phosphoglycolate phosphatase-like HAD superfamily hydrolase